jgi:hypothetical protein
MQRAVFAFVAVAALLPACAKSKPNEAPAPPPTTEAGVAPVSAGANAGKAALCSDGLHRRGDHWKVDCNVCRCGADGAILCSEFPCAERAAPDASLPATRDH